MDSFCERFWSWGVPFAEKRAALNIEIITLDDGYRSLERPPQTLDFKVDTQGFEKFVIARWSEVFSRGSYVLTELPFRPVYQRQSVYDELLL